VPLDARAEGSGLAPGVGRRSHEACEGPDLAGALLRELLQVTRLARSGDDLALEDRGGGVRLRLVAGPALDVVGGWRVVAIAGDAGGASAPVAGSTVTIVFGPDGRVSGSDGCGDLVGSYRTDGPALSAGPLLASVGRCAADLEDQRIALFGALRSSRGWAIDGGSLVLRDGSGVARLLLVPASAPPASWTLIPGPMATPLAPAAPSSAPG
jgi:heat shock protein HslJ